MTRHPLLDAAVNHERLAAGAPRWTLARMRAFDRACGSPHRGLRIIHVAGTKGKGSTAHFLEALLRAAGFRTGLYTSPHLVDVRERIRLDGRPISPLGFAAALEAIAPAIRRFRPTWFEILTEMAFVAFKECDWIVLETGMGGRLDATNIVRPRLGVITPIGMDHTDRLGATIAAIAREKAGIVKRGVPAVTSATGEALRYLPAGVVRAGVRGVPPLRARGAHQRRNAGLALAALRTLGLPLRPEALGGVVVPGRLQWFDTRPPFLVDTCHNVLSARALARELRGLRGRRRRMIFASAADKDVEGILAELVPEVEELLVTEFPGGRAMSPAALESIARRRGARCVRRFERPAGALRYLRSNPGRRDVGISAGSFYLAGKVIAELRKQLRTGADV